jgi:hypothetical protein
MKFHILLSSGLWRQDTCLGNDKLFTDVGKENNIFETILFLKKTARNLENKTSKLTNGMKSSHNEHKF